jgi:hypothetical protein
VTTEETEGRNWGKIAGSKRKGENLKNLKKSKSRWSNERTKGNF